ncbi:hypothetical protein GUITHDRAFT_101315 [Guillardia theta CCMP2712]|uniref:Uncharacterized protein n=1 Tax=Guillardia theta (strain CCMP2712) TaxID=905079 RepID=L1JWY8_GUITC|nr:hypothetical protein GUITHDRAFT_101315 [Guillardia theta CCMP2712]EKX52862.1 hypothetical protein GUITHDRAFT_101315 [Guillardia theta CCMP2712]|eukprot:XP_005839842.1 hypothetical protein GUITHDRAFT_101315 [Guillardia theta CCMP2712]
MLDSLVQGQAEVKDLFDMLRQEQKDLKARMQQDMEKKTKRKVKKSPALSKLQEATHPAHTRRYGIKLRYADRVPSNMQESRMKDHKVWSTGNSSLEVDDEFFECLIEREQKLLEVWQELSNRKAEVVQANSEDGNESTEMAKFEQRVSRLEQEMQAAKLELHETVRANCRSQTLVQLMASKVAVLESEAPNRGSVEELESLLLETARRVEHMSRCKAALDSEAMQLRRQLHVNESLAHQLQEELDAAVEQNQLAILELQPKDFREPTRPSPGRADGVAPAADVITLQAQLQSLRDELQRQRRLAKSLEEENAELRKESPAASPDVLRMMEARGRGRDD